MPGISLADRLVTAADRFPTIDAVVVFRPDLRRAWAAELAKAKPRVDQEAAVHALSEMYPTGWPRMEDYKNPTFGCRPLKVLRHLAPDHPGQVNCPIQLYDGPEWMIYVSGCPRGDNTAWRLFETLCEAAATTLPRDRRQGDTPLKSWLIDLAERNPDHRILDWSRPFADGEPWLPTWRPARGDDPWWTVRIKNVLDVSAKALQEPPHDPTPLAEPPFTEVEYRSVSRSSRVPPPDGENGTPCRPASEYTYTVIPPPDDFPSPEGGGAYAVYKENQDAAGELVALWVPGDPEAWHAAVVRHYPGVGFGQPCPWNMGWLPGCWEFSVFPLGLTARHIGQWLSVAAGIVRRAVTSPGDQDDHPNRGWRAMTRAARILADRFDSRSAQLLGMPLPLSPEAALAEMEAHRDAIITAMEKRKLLDEPSGTAVAADPREEENNPADPFAELRGFAGSELKGQERAVVEALCAAGGVLPIPDLGVKTGVGWSDAFEGFKNAQKRLNKKLKRVRWTLARQDNAARLNRLWG